MFYHLPSEQQMRKLTLLFTPRLKWLIPIITLFVLDYGCIWLLVITFGCIWLYLVVCTCISGSTDIYLLHLVVCNYIWLQFGYIWLYTSHLNQRGGNRQSLSCFWKVIRASLIFIKNSSQMHLQTQLLMVKTGNQGQFEFEWVFKGLQRKRGIGIAYCG